jgi:hypothetical protein
MEGTAHCAVRARKVGATSRAKSLLVNHSGGFTAGDAAARRPHLMVVMPSCDPKDRNGWGVVGLWRQAFSRQLNLNPKLGACK